MNIPNKINTKKNDFGIRKINTKTQHSNHPVSNHENNINNFIANTKQYITTNLPNMLGYQLFYPNLLNFDMKGKLKDLYNYPLQNRGDNWKSDGDSLGFNQLETEVINGFAEIYGFEKDKVKGFIANASTAGIIEGIYLATLKARSEDPNAKPVLLCSDQSHFSVYNTAKILDIPCIKATSDNISGNVLPTDMANKALEEIKKDPHTYPILCPVIGSTFKGASDDVTALCDAMKANGIEKYLMHVDAAFFGGTVPFLSSHHHYLTDKGKMPTEPVKIDFSKYDPRVISIQISGHKIFGTNRPTGIFIARSEVVDAVEAYLKNQQSKQNEKIQQDVIFQNERSTLGVLEAWVLLHTLIENKAMPQLIDYMLRLAEYIEAELTAMGVTSNRNPDSPTVVFEKPTGEAGEKIMHDFQLAEDNTGHAHLISMPHYNKESVDEFLDSMQSYKNNHQLHEEHLRNQLGMNPVDLSTYQLDVANQAKLDQLIRDMPEIITHNLSKTDFIVSKDSDQPIVYTELLGNLLNIHLNNVGDVWEEAHLKIDTREAERNALNSIAARLNFPEFTRAEIARIKSNPENKQYLPERKFWGIINSTPTTVMQALLVNRETAVEHSRKSQVKIDSDNLIHNITAEKAKNAKQHTTDIHLNTVVSLIVL